MTYFTEGKKKYVDGKRYNVDEYPADFTAWMAYRSIVDIVLGTDLVAYFAFCLTHFEAPESFGWIDIPLYLFGLVLMLFNLWAKSDAHRVLGDYAWCMLLHSCCCNVSFPYVVIVIIIVTDGDGGVDDVLSLLNFTCDISHATLTHCTLTTNGTNPTY